MTDASAAARDGAQANPLRGAVLMTLAGAGFALMTAVVRQISLADGMHAFEIAFFRNIFGLAFMLPWVMRTGLAGLKTKRVGLYTVRGVFSIMAMLSWFWAVTVLPLAEAVALSFTTPIFATVLAVLVLHEVVRARRWTATAIGFVGAMIILRPGVVAVSPAALVVLFSALSISAAIMTMKMLARTESANAIVTYMVIYLVPLSLAPALFVWSWPDAGTWPWLVALGALATFSHMCVTRAFAAADASAIMPFDFVRLPFAAAIGYFAFGESADVWTWVGAGVIFAAAVYITRREAVLARATRVAAETSRAGPAG